MRVHAAILQAYTGQDAGTGTIADLRRRLRRLFGRVRVARAKAGPATRSSAWRHCLEGETYLGLFPVGDLPAAQCASLVDPVCSESPSPLAAMRFRGVPYLYPGTMRLRRDARLIVAILGERVTADPAIDPRSALE